MFDIFIYDVSERKETQMILACLCLENKALNKTIIVHQPFDLLFKWTSMITSAKQWKCKQQMKYKIGICYGWINTTDIQLNCEEQLEYETLRHLAHKKKTFNGDIRKSFSFDLGCSVQKLIPICKEFHYERSCKWIGSTLAQTGNKVCNLDLELRSCKTQEKLHIPHIVNECCSSVQFGNDKLKENSTNCLMRWKLPREIYFLTAGIGKNFCNSNDLINIKLKKPQVSGNSS